MPHLQKIFEQYRDDNAVTFILVSLDDDDKRLKRYLDERKFAMTVAHAEREVAEQLFNVTDVPATFYIDRAGVIRYEARGLEVHGDADERIVWFIEELKKQ